MCSFPPQIRITRREKGKQGRAWCLKKFWVGEGVKGRCGRQGQQNSTTEEGKKVKSGLWRNQTRKLKWSAMNLVSGPRKCSMWSKQCLQEFWFCSVVWWAQQGPKHRQFQSFWSEFYQHGPTWVGSTEELTVLHLQREGPVIWLNCKRPQSITWVWILLLLGPGKVILSKLSLQASVSSPEQHGKWWHLPCRWLVSCVQGV